MSKFGAILLTLCFLLGGAQVVLAQDKPGQVKVDSKKKKRKRRRRRKKKKKKEEAELKATEVPSATPVEQPEDPNLKAIEQAKPSGTLLNPGQVTMPGAQVDTATITDDTTEEEEMVDFEEEEKRSDEESKRIISEAGGGGGGLGGGVGFKLFVDMLVDHELGEDKFEFRPNHTYVFIQVSYEDLSFMMHVSDSPIFFEVGYQLTPDLTLTMGKLLVPFGTNEFHHILGGRVDELSNFLPETWGDLGFSITHNAIDTESFGLEYVVYVLNGFAGVDAPVIAEGGLSDNNWFKAIGTRVRATFWGKLRVTSSVYYDRWDVDNKHPTLFYAFGAELQPGWIKAPFFDRLRLRGEWGRGEIQLPERNYQNGIIGHAFARSGYYAEAQYTALRWLALRLRVGRINPDNTVTDVNDVEVYEPAVLIGLGTKLWWTIAYQFLAKPGFDYTPKDPADVIYAKFFLQY